MWGIVWGIGTYVPEQWLNWDDLYFLAAVHASLYLKALGSQTGKRSLWTELTCMDEH